jgi:L,D-transpeptidase ErfK/SrfK
MKPCTSFRLILLSLFVTVSLPSLLFAQAGVYEYRPPVHPYGLDPQAQTLIGAPQTYIVRKKDTLLDIARNFDLGFSEIRLPYKNVDPWVPPPGLELTLPTFWILPEGTWNGILINIPEMRLYLFLKKAARVRTFPIGIGVEENTTPTGKYFVKEKRTSPTWYVPASLREKHEGKTSIPPGPDNPLGSHWLGLSVSGYGIHGTNFPWAVGRLVTHGCIRLYPEDIALFYDMVPVGTPVEIVYEPVKIGFKNGRILIEAHEDIYQRLPDLLQLTIERLETKGIREWVDGEKLKEVIGRKTGVPVDVTSDFDQGR